MAASEGENSANHLGKICEPDDFFAKQMIPDGEKESDYFSVALRRPSRLSI